MRRDLRLNRRSIQPAERKNLLALTQTRERVAFHLTFEGRLMRTVSVFPTGNVIWLNFFDETDARLEPSAVKARRRSWRYRNRRKQRGADDLSGGYVGMRARWKS
jgi:hypothetical protein